MIVDNANGKFTITRSAANVIVGRALPDARDGLKPAHRRVLYGRPSPMNPIDASSSVYATRRRPSSLHNHWLAWFQLVKIWVTRFFTKNIGRGSPSQTTFDV